MADAPEVQSRFSVSVRAVAPLEEAVSVWQIAQQLLGAHPEYGTLATSGRDGERREFGRWLALVDGMFDRKAMAARSVEVVDGRMLLLALGRLDGPLDAAMARSGLRRGLRRALDVPVDRLLVPWAGPAAETELVLRNTLSLGSRVRSCALDHEGALLAAGTEDGRLALYPAEAEGRAEGVPLLPRGAPAVWCAFSPNALDLATVHGGEGARVWNLPTLVEQRRFGAPATLACAFTPDGRRLVTADEREAVVWDIAGEGEVARVAGLHPGAIRHCAVSPDARLLATVSEDGSACLWDLAANELHARLEGHRGAVGQCAFSPDGLLLATAGQDGTARLWDVAGGAERLVLGGHTGPVHGCAFGRDGRMLATGGEDGTVRLWDVAGGSERQALHGHMGAVWACSFTADGQLLAAGGEDGTVRLWEEIELPRPLPQVSADSLDGSDLLDVARDAEALANLIAARDTSPPLSIGLFGDWGSGKSFLIKEVRRRVRALARRSRRGRTSAYCAHIRNVEFNAWHYADGNLWASLVTHIFDELARPEPDSDLSADDAKAQLARLEEELAANSALQDRLERARTQSGRLSARRQLRRLTWGAVGALGDEEGIAQLRQDLSTTRGQVRVLVPNTTAWLVTGGLLLVLAAAVAAAVALLGAGRAWGIAAGAAAWIAVGLGWLKVGAARARDLITRAGRSVTAAEVRSDEVDAQLAAARARERELREEIADLATGRRLGEFVVERSRSRDYRGHLGVVSQIHRDFEQLSRLLRGGRAGDDGGGDDALPRIDRIVLYIDDLDRCPPRRVVEVLEAVHLILALPLFVVVVAVDPRWLLRSLRLHYADLLGGDPDEPEGEEEGGLADEWRSTPLNYLEKIIQVPYTLRPITAGGARSLVEGLLPVAAPPQAAPGAAGAAPGADSAAGAAPGDGAAPPAPPLSRAQAPAAPPPSLSPRTLTLAPGERDVAATIATGLPTPRAIKKFTNLYRLLRAGLDERSGELDAFLDAGGRDIPEYQAVLVLLAAVIAFPEEAPDLLLGLGDLDPEAGPAEDAWGAHLDALESAPPPGAERWAELCRFLRAATGELEHGGTSRTEPFRRWGLEVARYSFASGLRVFARRRASAD